MSQIETVTVAGCMRGARVARGQSRRPDTRRTTAGPEMVMTRESFLGVSKPAGGESIIRNEAGEAAILRCQVAPFNTGCWHAGAYEWLERGAFTAMLLSKTPIPICVDHQMYKRIAEFPHSAKLWETAEGLQMECTVRDTLAGQSLIQAFSKGRLINWQDFRCNVLGCSIGLDPAFIHRRPPEICDGKWPIRRLRVVPQLREISIATVESGGTPAYPHTWARLDWGQALGE